jgi:hypothetical protein
VEQGVVVKAAVKMRMALLVLLTLGVAVAEQVVEANQEAQVVLV